nr:hypothetical protein DM860_008347 [Ipomoea batatas]
MAMGPERSRPLHNFTLPCELKWGNQKFLRCVKLDSNGEIAAPWSLRTRRSAVKPPNGFAASADGGGGSRPENNSPLPIHRSGVAAAAPPSVPSDEKRERAKFAVPLARREIEEDFMAIVGHRPARRPKKRAKLVQKNLDTLFPGLWLTEITADLYKVPDDQ